MHHLIKKAHIRFGIMKDFFGFLWKHKLWWIIPVVFLLLFIMLFLFVAGHTGVAAFIYPIF